MIKKIGIIALLGLTLKVHALQEIHVTGNGNNILDGQAVPSANNFTDMGDLLVPGASQIERTYTILNIGNAPLSVWPISKPRSEGGADIGFSIVQQPANFIPPGGGSNFKVRFDPFANTVGSYVAYLFITNSDPNETIYNFTIRADVISPEIVVENIYSLNIADGSTTPAYVNSTDFGLVEVGTNNYRTYIIKNTGNASLILGNVQVLNDPYHRFEITKYPNWWVPPGTNTDMIVRFTPFTWAGDETAEISIDTTDSDEDPFNFDIRGQGINSDITVIGNNVIVSNTANYGYIAPTVANNTDFTSVPVGGYIERNFTIQNVNIFGQMYGADLDIHNIANLSNGFSIISAPDLLVPNGDSTEMTMRFDAVAVGNFTSLVTIANSDVDDNPYTFFVRANAVVPSVDTPEINVTGNSQDILNNSTAASVSLLNHTQFLDTLVGDTTFRTYTIQNVGEGDSFLSISMVADPGNSFAVSQQPIGPIEAGTSTTLIIGFSPAAVGSFNAEVIIKNNDADEQPYSFMIQGRGIVP